jgi:CRP-like cAMP-binding protein
MLMYVLQSAGEYGLINGLKRQRTLTAKRDSELLVMERHRYVAMTEADPGLALLLSRICMVREASCAVTCACACECELVGS